MNKMIKNIIIMAVVVVVAVAAVLVMPLLQPKEPVMIYSDDPRVADIAPTPAPDASGGEKFWFNVKNIFSGEPEYIIVEPTPDPALFIFSDYKSDDVVEITMDNENGELTIYQKDGVWYVKGHEEFETNQNKAKDIAYTMAYVKAEQLVTDDMSRLSEFGLDDRADVVTVKFQDGTEHIYYVGNAAPKNNEYYMMMDGKDQIFTVWTNYANNAKASLDDLREYTTVGMLAEDVVAIEMMNSRGEEFKLEPVDPANDIALGVWEVTSPFTHYANAELIYGTETSSGIIEQMINVRASGILEGDSKNPGKYGLDEPIAYIALYNEEGEVSRYTLAEYGNEYTYAMMFDGDTNVYKVNKSALGFIDKSLFEVMDKMLALVGVKVVDSIDIDLPGVQTKITVDHVVQKDNDGKDKIGSDGKPMIGQEFSLDGKLMPDEDQPDAAEDAGTPHKQMVWFYQDLIGMKINRMVNPDEQFEAGDAVGSIRYALNSAYRSDYTLEFYEYDVNNYAVVKNGEDAYYLVTKKYVEYLAGRFGHLKTGTLDSGY